MTKEKKLLKSIKLTWWQAGIFKSAAVSFGILLGLYFYEYLAPFPTLFWAIFITCGLYILSLWLKK